VQPILKLLHYFQVIQDLSYLWRSLTTDWMPVLASFQCRPVLPLRRGLEVAKLIFENYFLLTCRTVKWLGALYGTRPFFSYFMLLSYYKLGQLIHVFPHFIWVLRYRVLLLGLNVYFLLCFSSSIPFSITIIQSPSLLQYAWLKFSLVLLSMSRIWHLNLLNF
jgi:hypothetical protein